MTVTFSTTASRLTLKIVGCCFAAAAICGCGGGSSQALGPPFAGSAFLQRIVRYGGPGDGGSSWIADEAKSEDLLYVTDHLEGAVTIYSYPRGKLVGKLKGFSYPEAECSNKAGDVFIIDGVVVEYAHASKKRLQTLTGEPGYAAQDCASDPTTGDLAVTWDLGFSKGYVAIYKHATGTPTLYQKSGAVFAYCGYDGKGDLFVDGMNSDEAIVFKFIELPKGGKALKSITLNQTFGGSGGVQWDGTYVVVGDDDTNNIYRFAISGSKGTLQGTTTLENAPEVLQFWIQGSNVIAGITFSRNSSVVAYWDYPAGGDPTKTITKAIDGPFGVTISKAAK